MFKTMFRQYVFLKNGKINFIDCFSECNLFERSATMVCHSCAFESADLPFINDISYDTYSEILFSFKQYLIAFIL